MEPDRFCQTILNHMSEPVYVRNLKRDLIYINPAFERLTGWTAAEALGRKCHEVFGNVNQACGRPCPAEKAIDRKIPIIHYNGKLKIRNGDEKNVRISISPLYVGETAGGAVIVMEDITYLKAMEQTGTKTLIALEKEKEKYHNLYNLSRLIADNVPDLIWAKNTEGRFIFVNQAMCDKLLMCGTPDNALGKTDMDFARQERNAGYKHTFGETCIDSDTVIRKTKAPGRFLEDGFVRNKYLVLDVYKAPIFNEDGKMIGTVGCGRDVTKEKEVESALQKVHEELEQKVEKRTQNLKNINKRLADVIAERRKAEAKLRKSEEKYRGIFDESVTAIYVIDDQKRIVDANRAGLDLLGYSKKELLCMRIPDVLVDPPAMRPALEKLLSGVRLINTEHQLIRKDGRIITVLNNSIPLTNVDGTVTGIQSTLLDITERKHLQRQLIRSERLAAAGQLSAVIAHEINSPLQGIVSLLYSIEAACRHDEKLLEDVAMIRKGFGSIRDTVRKLLDLNRPGREKKQSMNINKVIEDTVALLSVHLKKNKVSVQMNLSSRIPDMNGSPQNLGQVFINLVNNAVEAMTGISRIDVRWKERTAGGGVITIASNLRKGKIIVRVSDTGPGIAYQDLEHIFDPFYTRKKTMGMGIGLSVCNDIIRDHGGTITAKNSPNGGAVFTIVLPV